jgi:repressor LexA
MRHKGARRGELGGGLLTARQREVLDFIVDYVRCHGIAPTFAEIGDGIGCRSSATVHKHVEMLERKGVLVPRNWNHARALRVSGACPYCGAEAR